MITAERIRKLAFLDIHSLEQALKRSYPKDRIETQKFVGITNAGEFCYDCTFWDEQLEENCRVKVFVNLCEDGEPIADY